MNNFRDQIFLPGVTFNVLDYIEGKDETGFGDNLLVANGDQQYHLKTRDLAFMVDTTKRGGNTTLSDNVKSMDGEVPTQFTIVEHINSAEEGNSRVHAYKVRPVYNKH